jgi:hypothetical protein
LHWNNNDDDDGGGGGDDDKDHDEEVNLIKHEGRWEILEKQSTPWSEVLQDYCMRLYLFFFFFGGGGCHCARWTVYKHYG